MTRPARKLKSEPDLFLCAAVLAVIAVTGPAASAAVDEPPSIAHFETLGVQYTDQIRPLVTRFCLKCHASQGENGEPDLERFRVLDDVRRDPAVWEQINLMLGSGEMPPQESEQLDVRQRVRIQEWIEAYLATEARARSGDPGPVVLRRLNNAEFTYTIRDLTGIELSPTRDFPADGGAGEGFTNSGTASGMSPELLQKYLDSTREVASHAVLVPHGFRFSIHTTRSDRTGELLAGIRAIYARYTSGNSDVSVLDKWNVDEGTHASANDGRVDTEPYLIALIQHREDLIDGIEPGELAAVAGKTGLSAKYLRILAEVLVAPNPDSLLLEWLRDRWREARPADAGTLATQIRSWQDKLWKVNPVGVQGLVQAWHEPISPDEGFDDFRLQAEERVGRRRAGALLDRSFDDFRRVLPASMCFARIIPVDNHVTLLLYHREDEPLRRLMLEDAECVRLDRLWDELLYVSREPIELEGVLHGILALDNDDLTARVKPFRTVIEKRAAAFRRRLKESESAHLTALTEFLSRAYRRPLTEHESQRLVALYRSLRDQSVPHEEAFRLTLARGLTAAAFLFRFERRRETDTSGNGAADRGIGRPAAHPVSDFELATRLSYFLWSSLPDDQLRADARSGRLACDADSRLIANMRRMLQDARVRRLAIEFACQWLQIRDFDQFEKSETLFPGFETLRGAMYEESIRFFADLFRNDRSVLTILQADHSFLNEELAEHYAIPGVTGREWRRVDGMRGYSRGGILVHSAVLARHSGASRTNPILRGTFVVETLLGEHLPRPPADVPRLPDTNPAARTQRELIERHSSAAECAGCHQRIDPFGFALEDFDAIGRLRPGASSPGTRATLADGTHIHGLDGLRSYLLTRRRDAFVRQFCRKLLGYALGRAVRLSDRPLQDEMMTQLKAQDFRISVALETIVMSDQFRMIRAREATRKE